ncbi:PepSY-like domain-containing protein [Sphingobacterium wenxiniae]|uniref:Putative beta-lactamase-inhibitor-like, PepSY-like n=1 Tax=Sphingobacterium wenxiniae TaxID=683125 RepID=A0A1I6T2X3_9SPHI|nr:PepSY-like domain-containing protein [Sphingobacterium wenxiniae]SFS83317.1 Putative beta-lactamase-inhibitor-like, PepSY-like [Sphingobacterium wenxiniae]
MMKRAFLGLSALAVVTVMNISCDDDKVVTEKELPLASNQFLSSYFAGVDITRVEKERNNYSVNLANGVEVDFNSAGEWIDVDAPDGMALPTGFINPKIVAYVAAEYTGNGINSIEKTNQGFDVDLVTGDIDLVFNATGDFVRVDP